MDLSNTKHEMLEEISKLNGKVMELEISVVNHEDQNKKLISRLGKIANSQVAKAMNKASTLSRSVNTFANTLKAISQTELFDEDVMKVEIIINGKKSTINL